MRDGSGHAGADHGGAENGAASTGDTEAAYRGFLFSDLRGFTAFVESSGDNAAADLLDAYRSLVREQVARLAGAEIRTEGDSFYVVFPSARAAVACGLAIAAAAATYSEHHADRQIRVGIGINAGETTQRGDGFVGTAVNLAARVCSQARAGEVLVTGTVREAVRGASDLRFVARGSRRLKGIAESVPLYAVEVAGKGPRHSAPGWVAARRPGRGVAIVGLVAATAVVLAFAVRFGWLGGAGDGGLAADPSVAPAASVDAGNQPSAAPTEEAATALPVSVEFPNEDETALLARIDGDIAAHCERADPDERPRFIIDADTAAFFGISSREPLAGPAGVTCTIPSSIAPSTIHYWSTSQVLDYGPLDAPAALIQNHAGAFNLPSGDCGVGAPAVGPWEFGGREGRVLCREVYGEAVIEWSYDGLPIVGVAVRRDGDHARLYAWWRDEARFLRN